MSNEGVHLSHCYQGEYHDSCKYGEPLCPARSSKAAWDHHFLSMAQLVAERSKDPSTQVGAVIVDEDKHIVSTGFNGFPRGIKDDDRLYNRELKYEIIIHGEINAVLAAGKSVKGCTLYTYPLPPCSRCASMLIQAGITRVVAPPAHERWVEACKLAKDLFQEAGVSVETINF